MRSSGFQKVFDMDGTLAGNSTARHINTNDLYPFHDLRSLKNKRVKRSLFVTTLGALPGWPVIERIAHERGLEPIYDGCLGRQSRSTATIQVTLSGQGEANGVASWPGSAVIMDGTAHPGLRYRAIGSWDFFYVNLLGAGPQIVSLVAAHGHVMPFPHRHPLLRRWLAQLPEAGDGHRALPFPESHRLAAELLGLLTLAPAADGGLAEQALALMSSGWDRNLGLDQVAREMGISTEHLSRTFHRVIGETPAAWYRRHRLERACDLLRTSSAAVQEISVRCGYPSPAYFVASFRAALGTTPARWRAVLQRDLSSDLRSS